MATIIVYASKTGTTKQAAEMLSEKLGGCDIADISKQSFDLSKYDTVIIGSYIRMGIVDKKITKFMLKYISVLVEKKTAFFICNCFGDNLQEYVEHCVPPQLLSKMVASATFGGKLEMEKLHGLDRIAAKAVAKADYEKGIVRKFDIIPANISEFAKKVSEVA